MNDNGDQAKELGGQFCDLAEGFPPRVILQSLSELSGFFMAREFGDNEDVCLDFGERVRFHQLSAATFLALDEDDETKAPE